MTPSPTRLVDPVHFFNAMGVSVLTAEYQGDRIAELEAENADLKRKLIAAIHRLRELMSVSEDDEIEI